MFLWEVWRTMFSRMKRRQLKGAVVVLTGASSGIGRAAAFMFARRGARLVLAARDPRALEEVASECRNTYGAQAAKLYAG